MQGNWTKYFVREHSLTLLKQLRVFAFYGKLTGAKPYSSFEFERLLGKEYHVMARKKSTYSDTKNAPGVQARNNNAVWLNYRPSAEDVGVILSDAEDPEQLCARLASIFAHGADFSVRYVPDRKNWSAFCISAPSAVDNRRTGISAFGGTVWQALSALLFKVDLLRQDPDALTESGGGAGVG